MEEIINPEHPYQLYTDNFEGSVEELGSGSYAAKYLSWSVCWDKMKQLYPNARHEMITYDVDGKHFMGCYAPDGSLMVHCKIFYETPDGNEYVHNEYLAVRDNRKQSVQGPNSVQIENTYRRALAKGVSTLTGFGLSLWTGEDLQEMKQETQTYMNGKAPKPGQVSVDQTVKLEHLMTDKYTTESDKRRIKLAKDSGWEGIQERHATILIADVEQGRKGNMNATSKEIKTAIDSIELMDVDNKIKEECIKLLNEKKRSRNYVSKIMEKLKTKEGK